MDVTLAASLVETMGKWMVVSMVVSMVDKTGRREVAEREHSKAGWKDLD
jgi:hypothetical protein